MAKKDSPTMAAIRARAPLGLAKGTPKKKTGKLVPPPTRQKELTPNTTETKIKRKVKSAGRVAATTAKASALALGKAGVNAAETLGSAIDVGLSKTVGKALSKIPGEKNIHRGPSPTTDKAKAHLKKKTDEIKKLRSARKGKQPKAKSVPLRTENRPQP